MKTRFVALLLALPVLASAQETQDTTKEKPVVNRREQVERRAARQTQPRGDREEPRSVRKAQAKKQAQVDRIREPGARGAKSDGAGEEVARAAKTDVQDRTSDGPGTEKTDPRAQREGQDDAGKQRGDAQRGGTQEPPKTDKTDAPTDRPRETTETDAPKIPERDVRKTGEPTTDRPVADRAELTKKLELEERKHRERLARIARLRELALEKNQTDRLRALEDLERRQNAHYERLRSEARASLGERDFDDVDRGLSHGRGRGPSQNARVHDERAKKDGEHRPADEPKKDAPKKDAPKHDKP